MPIERATFTALPNGVVDTPAGLRLRVCVFIAPRITLEAGDAGFLGECSRFNEWPVHLPEFGIADSLGGHAHGEPDPGYPKPDAEVWSEVYSPKLPVETHEVTDLSQRVLRSFPAAEVAGGILDFYAGIAAGSPFGFPPTDGIAGALAPLVGLTGPPGRRYPELDRLLPPGAWDPETGRPLLKRKQSRFLEAPSGPHAGKRRVQAFAQLARFYDRPGTQQPREKDQPADTPPPPKRPQFDFHRVCALVADYPLLLRLLGLAADLLVDPAELQIAEGSGGEIRVVVDGSEVLGWAEEEQWRPWTNFVWEGGLFVAGAKDDRDADIRRGMLDLTGKERFSVSAFDLDGSAHKLIQLARSAHVLASDPASHDPAGISVPALRSAGITVIRTDRARRIATLIDETNAHAATAGSADPPRLWADDVNRGYRVDIEHDGAGDWRSLCARTGSYLMRWAGRPAVPLPVPAEDEGYVKGGTASAVTGGAPDLYLHEALFGWEGWSLVAGRPGKHVGQLAAEEHSPTQADLAQECPLETHFEVSPGTLPALRFGHTFRLRARAVDLAGNSHDLASAPGDMATEPVTFRRFEPVPPPVVVPRWPFAEGESGLRMVIRSTRGNGPAEYLDLAHVKALPRHSAPPPGPVSFTYRVADERHIVPAKTSQQMAELHGKFDPAFGAHPEAIYDEFYELASREEKALADPSAPDYHVIGPMNTSIGVGEVATEPGVDGAYFLRDSAQLTVTYLPDPFAGSASLSGPPVRLSDIIEFSGGWPGAEGFRIRIVDGPAGTVPQWVDTAGDPRVLVVTLPQAAVVHVRLSSGLRLQDLDQMGVWHLLSPEQRDSLGNDARWGLHWMLTPRDELVLVHAVERPLADPALHLRDGDIDRSPGATFAVLDGHIYNHAKSTGRLDVDADWTEPVDDVLRPAPGSIAGTAHVGDFNIDPGEDQALTGQDDSAQGASPRVHKLRHEFGDTRHRWVTYRVTATTRFRDYFPPEITNDASLITAQSADPQLRRSVPSSRRPDPPEVLYIVPTFTWKDERWRARRTGKLPRQPGHRRVRGGGGLRVYLDRPWYSSGEDEHLAAVVLNQRPPWAFGVLGPQLAAQVEILARAGVNVDVLIGAARRLKRRGVTAEMLISAASDAASRMMSGEDVKPVSFYGAEIGTVFEMLQLKTDPSRYVSDWGADPAWAGGSLGARPRIDSFTNAETWGTGLSLAELPGQKVAAAAWIPKYDEDRHLWFCDIELDVGDRYFPFVRLSLARYQPHSVPGLHLSKTVRAEFAQLLPERRTTIYADPKGGMQASVEGVAGFNWFARWARPEAGGYRDYVESSRLVRIQIQRRRLSSRSDLDWAAASQWRSLDHRETDRPWIGRWLGSVKVKSEIDGRFEYRLMVEERELYDTDPSQAEYVFQSERINPTDPFNWGAGGLQTESWESPVRSRLIYADEFPLVVNEKGHLATTPPQSSREGRS